MVQDGWKLRDRDSGHCRPHGSRRGVARWPSVGLTGRRLLGLLLYLLAHVFDVSAGALGRVLAASRNAHQERNEKKAENAPFDVGFHDCVVRFWSQ
jgi:hypothetical protein